MIFEKKIDACAKVDYNIFTVLRILCPRGQKVASLSERRDKSV